LQWSKYKQGARHRRDQRRAGSPGAARTVSPSAALCDSSGLSAFVVIGRGGAGPVRLTGVNPQLQHLLDRTGLAELLAVGHPPAVGDEVREAG
jgi:hypothetical protein